MICVRGVTADAIQKLQPWFDNGRLEATGSNGCMFNPNIPWTMFVGDDGRLCVASNMFSEVAILINSDFEEVSIF